MRKATPARFHSACRASGEMHLMLEVLQKQAGIDITHVPFNVASQAIVELLAERLDAMFLVIPPIKEHVDRRPLLRSRR